MVGCHGFEAAERWARFNNEPAPLTLRTNTLRTTRAALEQDLREHGIECRHTAVAPDGLVVTTGNPLQTPLVESGLFVLQDEASQAAPALPSRRAGERVLDTCAAPGGKSLAVAAAVGAEGLVIAGDIRGRRLDLLRQTLVRGGAERAHAVTTRSERGPALRRGVRLRVRGCALLRPRHDPARPGDPLAPTAEDLELLAAAQLQMLEHAARAVRPGGRLVVRGPARANPRRTSASLRRS